MNGSQKARLSDRIRARLQELEQENARGAEGQSVVVLDQQSVGRLSRMDALQNQQMALAQQKRRDQERARLTAALARLGDEDFGYCEDCGEAIAPGRLDLDPACRHCIQCASG